ncbi:MAG: D-mannose binding lectin [Pseudonocardiales bacterium]|nr:D-mannose binding lectin [Pseudonocardiales bacterium]
MPRDPRTMASRSIRLFLAAVLGSVGAFVAFLAPAGAVAPSSLAAPGLLAGGQSLTSASGTVSLTMQSDGNLVLHDAAGAVTWNSGTWGHPGAYFAVQSDSNLVVYLAGVAIWNSHTSNGPSGSVLTVQDDGNVVLTSIGGVVLWSARLGIPTAPVTPAPVTLGPVLTVGQPIFGGSVMKSANRNFTFSVQTDGNLVLYDAMSRALFATGTRTGVGPYNLVLQTDGNLVLYASNGALWNSQSRGSGATTLTLQDDGNLVLTGPGGPVWWTATRLVFGSTGNPDPSVTGPNLVNAATLTSGKTLTDGQSLTSANGLWSFFMQDDGTLAVYGPGGILHWTSNTPNHAGAKLTLIDGNLAATSVTGVKYFSTGTTTGSTLIMQDDGNLVLYSAGSAVLWVTTPSSPRPNGAIFQGDKLTAGQSVFSASGAFTLTQQDDGNLVLYGGGVARWSANTRGRAAYTVLQTDGNLVVYSSSGAPLFYTGTVTFAKVGSRLTVQDDGNLVLSDADGTPVWATTYSAAAPPGYQPTLAAPPSSTSRYVRNLSSNQTANAAIMSREGCADAQANPGGRAYLGLLDFGAQIDTGNGLGVILTVTSIRLTNAAVISAVRSYIDGYVGCRAMPSYLTVAVGTNNDGSNAFLGRGGGALWASAVINPLSAYAATLPSVAIAGANDMEPGFNGTMAQSYDWLDGYLNATGAQFMFFGSADGCPTRPNTSSGSCNNGWTMAGLYHLAFGAMPTRALAMPEIYSNALAVQWANISLAGVVTGNSPAAYAGPMTELVACQQAGSCGSPSPTDAWNMLLAAVNANPRTRLTGMLYTTDLRIDR